MSPSESVVDHSTVAWRLLTTKENDIGRGRIRGKAVK